MATKDEHVTWANHNNSFWAGFDINATPFVDWVVTGIFYEALHWVEGFLATKGHHSGAHGDRASAMHRHAKELSAIQIDYDTLKLDSENARYRCYKHTPEEVEQDIIPLLDSVRSHVSKLV